MRIHTLQGLYLYVENLLQAIISLVKTRSYPNTTCPSYVFLFSQAICHQAEFPAAWHRTAVFSCPALLPAGKGDKYGTGEKRMPWGTLHQQRQTVFRHCFSEHIGQIWNPQPIFQGLHRTERNITYQTIGRAEKSMLRFWGVHGLPFLSDTKAWKLSAIPRFRQTGLHGSELCCQYFQGTLSAGQLWTHPLFPWQWPCRNGSPAANQKGVWQYQTYTWRFTHLQRMQGFERIPAKTDRDKETGSIHQSEDTAQ